jgi:hypothetical protein
MIFGLWPALCLILLEPEALLKEIIHLIGFARSFLLASSFDFRKF